MHSFLFDTTPFAAAGHSSNALEWRHDGVELCAAQAAGDVPGADGAPGRARSTVLDRFIVAVENRPDIQGVTRALGGNKDGHNANAITFTAFVNGWADQDRLSVTGI